MACPCCYQPCCRNGYPTITFTISGGTVGIPWCGAYGAQSDCSPMNGSYVFSGEDIALGTVGSMTREFTIMPGCPDDPQGRWTFQYPIVATWRFQMSCNGRGNLLNGVIGDGMTVIAEMNTRAIWQIVWQDLQVDPEDGCYISGSYGPSPPTTFFHVPGYWGDQCGGPPGVSQGTYGPTTVRLAANISR
jgi:hypothetical protein